MAPLEGIDPAAAENADAAQANDAAIAQGRKVATLGLSMKKNMRLAREMGYLHIPEASIVDIEEMPRYAPGEVCIVCTGSPGMNRGITQSTVTATKNVTA